MNQYGSEDVTSASLGKLLDLIRTLRSENGCPWDRKQTSHSMHPYILEEYHEMVQAINDRDPVAMTDEMGDVLFLVMLVAYMFEQEGVTTVQEIIETVCAKMTRRHPHVFGDAVAKDADEVISNWSAAKASEEVIQQRASLLDGIPRSLPALSRAQKLASRAAKCGFDWNRPQEVFVKVDEELNELKDAVNSASPDEIRGELGDLLFVVANVARHLGVNSEAALNETSDKFERRFRYIEAALKSQGRSTDHADLAEMDELWEEAKTQEKRSV